VIVRAFLIKSLIAYCPQFKSHTAPSHFFNLKEKKISLGAVLQFRQALCFMNVKYPFSLNFGPADTRDRCIKSSQRVFRNLLLRTPERDDLPFETLALLAKSGSGRFEEDEAKELIRVFRPNRDGRLSELDFVRSIDRVYKAARLLSANISSSSNTDRAVENLINACFYCVLGFYVIGEFGIDPLRIFFSFSSVILAFAFMFGSSAAKYFEVSRAQYNAVETLAVRVPNSQLGIFYIQSMAGHALHHSPAPLW
jgi:hypothetical protein